jgi:uncharacterized protein (TIGR02466 family)
MDRTETNITQLFASPLMEVQLDLDVEKLTEFAFQLQDRDKKGVQISNKGGYHSNPHIHIQKKQSEEFIRLKKEITQYLQIYHSEVFRGMVFRENIILSISEMWININEKHHYNELHFHSYSTLSGAYYIKHDGSIDNGNISFKHPNQYINIAHWPEQMIEIPNEMSADIFHVTPKPNMLLIFPSWLEHKAELNLKNDTRISVSFNSQCIEKKL